MEASSSNIKTSIVHPPFIALALSFFGWALIEAWLVSLQAIISLHLLASIPGIFLVYLSFRRLPKFRLRLFQTGTATLGFRFTAADVCETLLLCGIGGLLGTLILTGWSFPVIVVAMGIHFAPWWRLRLCREHFLGASTLLWLTGCLVIATGYRTLDFLTLPIAGWALWTGATFSMLHSLLRISHAERIALRPKAEYVFSRRTKEI
jgi:hypothetical protein